MNFNTFRSFKRPTPPFSDPRDPATEYVHKFPLDEELSQRTLWLCFVVGLVWSTLGLACALPFYDRPTLFGRNSYPATLLGQLFVQDWVDAGRKPPINFRYSHTVSVHLPMALPHVLSPHPEIPLQTACTSTMFRFVWRLRLLVPLHLSIALNFCYESMRRPTQVSLAQVRRYPFICSCRIKRQQSDPPLDESIVVP